MLAARGNDNAVVQVPFLVSVVLPVHNDERHLGRAIESVLRLIPPVLELIVIDDGSTDGSGRIADEATRDPRVRVVHQPNAGPGAGANVGIGMARGTHVLFLDSDDEFLPSITSSLEPLVTSCNPDVVSYAALVVDDEGRRVEPDDIHYAKPDIPDPISGVDYYLRVESRGPVTASSNTYLFRSDLLKSSGVRSPEGFIHEDEYFTAAVLIEARSVISTSQRLYLRRNRPGSITTLPVSRRNISGWVHSAALLCHRAQDSRMAGFPGAAPILRRRSRQQIRSASIMALSIGEQTYLRQALMKEFGGIHLRELGWRNWFRVRLGA